MALANQIAGVFLASVGIAFSLQVATTEQRDGTYWMRLDNTGDVQYTGLMRVGGHRLNAIVDTGSFELLVFGKNCTACGTPEHLYDGTKSPHYRSTGFIRSHSFGSGTTTSVEASDAVEIGSAKILTQVFWEVVDANMPIMSAESFQAILGVGPPSGIIGFAESDAARVHKELKQYKKHGSNVTKKIRDIVEYYDEAVVHANNLTTVAENLGVQNMAVCLNKGSGSPGWFIWNDKRTLQHPSKFTEIKVTGDVHWSANLTNVRIGNKQLEGKHVSRAVKKAAEAVKLGCQNENCSAVLDTGTSLIVAPTETGEMIFNAMRNWINAGGTCDDLSDLPDLEFNLNGITFSLPPESYVGEIDGELGEDMRSFMPHLRENTSLYDSVGCRPLLMTMDVDSQFGPLWIFGQPFFRKYYTNFKFTKHLDKMSLPEATTMSFSVADEECRPGYSPVSEIEKQNLLGLGLGLGGATRKAELRVDASKLRVSYLARKVKLENHGTSRMIFNPRVRI